MPAPSLRGFTPYLETERVAEGRWEILRLIVGSSEAAGWRDEHGNYQLHAGWYWPGTYTRSDGFVFRLMNCDPGGCGFIEVGDNPSNSITGAWPGHRTLHRTPDKRGTLEGWIECAPRNAGSIPHVRVSKLEEDYERRFGAPNPAYQFL